MKKLIDSFDVFVFDLDNTLVITNFDYIYCLIKETINNLGGIIPDQILAKKFWYAEINGKECVEKYFNLSFHEFWKLFREEDKVKERVKYTKVIDGVNSTLQFLKDNGKEIAIITNAYPSVAVAEIRMLEIDFSEDKDKILATGGDGNPIYNPKPHRHCLDYLKDYVFQDKDNFVYIGDSHEDALFAKNAKTSFVHFNISDSELPSNLKALISFSSWKVFNELLIK